MRETWEEEALGFLKLKEMYRKNIFEHKMILPKDGNGGKMT